MSKLQEFLISNPIHDLVEEVVLSERFQVDGEILKFKVKPVPSEEFATLQRKHTKIGKKGKTDFDNGAFQTEIVLDFTIEPDFRNAEAIKKAGCLTPKQYLNKSLKAGEVVELFSEISRISGFDEDLEELKEKAKN